MLPAPDETWSTRALFVRAVADTRSEAAGEHAYWDTVYLLHKRDPQEVWPLVAPLAHNQDPALRSLVPDVLRFLGGRERPRHAETMELLRDMLRVDQPPRVLISIATAFVDLADEAAVELLTPLVTHPDADVRSAAVHGLLPVARLVVPELIALSRDPADHVRDWATFGLGSQTDLDTPELREALAARLEDDHEDTRAEAALGLAVRKDPRALPIVRRELESESVGTLYVEAAAALGDESLYGPLQALAANNPGDPDIEEALLACRPSGR
jgi:HEAT repeat protein